MIFSQETIDSSHTNSQYYFLATSDEPLSVNARRTIDNWLVNYPDSDSADFRTRFCSSDDLSHLSAFFELYIFSLFSLHGFKVRRGEVKMPDFHIQKDQVSFHAECTMAGDSQHQEGVYKYLKGFTEKINEIKSDYFLNFSVWKYADAPLRMGKLKKYLENSLHKPIIDSTKKLSFDDNGWEIEISLVRKENQNNDNFGMLFTGLKWVNAPKYLKQAIHDKRPKKYSFQYEPYIICVNSMESGLNENEIKQTLFGDARWSPFFSETKNRSISGVIIVKSLYPQWIEKVLPKYYQNPWAKHPINMPNLKIGFTKK